MSARSPEEQLRVRQKQQGGDVSAAAAPNPRLGPHLAGGLSLRPGAPSWASHSSLMGHLGRAHSRPSTDRSSGPPSVPGRNQRILLPFLPHGPAPHRLQQTHHQALPTASPHSPRSPASSLCCSLQSVWPAPCPCSVPFRVAPARLGPLPADGTSPPRPGPSQT